MTDLRKAAEMALKTLENERLKKDEHLLAVVEEALRQALAQPEQEPVCAHGVGKTKCDFCKQPEQEPVAWRNTETGEFCTGGFLRKDFAKWIPLYTAPPKREWVGLTQDDKNELFNNWWNKNQSFNKLIEDTEEKLMEKNT